jgi:hypothetical protein
LEEDEPLELDEVDDGFEEDVEEDDVIGRLDDCEELEGAFAQPTINILRSEIPNRLLLFFKMISP